MISKREEDLIMNAIDGIDYAQSSVEWAKNQLGCKGQSGTEVVLQESRRLLRKVLTPENQASEESVEEPFSFGLEPRQGEIKHKGNCYKIDYIGQSSSELYFIVTARVPIFPKEDELVTLCDNSRGGRKNIQDMTKHHFGGRVLPMSEIKQKYVIVYKD